jgi:opacity protein-like surface antigen/outer membrane protease
LPTSFGKYFLGRAMNTRTKYFLRASLIASILLQGASALMPTSAVAADLPPPPPRAATWTWTGLYFGGSAGAAAGTTTFSDPLGPSVFGDTVKTSAFLAGLQVGYNWQVAPRWVVGLQGDASYLASNGSFTCMQRSAAIVGSNCEVSPHVLASLTGRAGFLVDPLGRTLLYGKGGGAWLDSDLLIVPNSAFPGFLNDPAPGPGTSTYSKAWGGTVGGGIEHALTPAWSVSLEYDYYRFVSSNITTPATVSSTGGNTPLITRVASNTTSVTPDMQVVKLALNYHWDQNPFAVWADTPVFAMTAMPFKTRAAPILQGWELDAGTRYWYSSGNTKNTTQNTSLLSQLTYANATGQSGEIFGRADTPWRLFVKGYIGTGSLSGGKTTDEDWGEIGTNPDNLGFQVTNSTQSGWLNYAAADVGYDVLGDSHYKLGPFVGYSYFRQNVNAFGCSSSVSPQACNVAPNAPFLTQDETWQSLRVGVSAVARIWDRWSMNGDIAYLPYGQYSGLDTHPARNPVTFFPQTGTSRGVQAELILTYLLTDSLELGIGGRYWAMWTTSGSQNCFGQCGNTAGQFTVGTLTPYSASTERFGGFVQANYRFATYP